MVMLTLTKVSEDQRYKRRTGPKLGTQECCRLQTIQVLSIDEHEH
jgi:hypothetical protein